MLSSPECGDHKFGVAFIGLVVRFPPAALVSSGKGAPKNWLQVAAVGTQRVPIFQVIGGKAIRQVAGHGSINEGSHGLGILVSWKRRVVRADRAF